MNNKYLAILVVILIICFGIFIYQYNNDVSTFIIINNTQVSQNETINGLLLDSYGNGVANKTITFHKPGYGMGTIVSVNTDKNGQFTIYNAEYLSNAGKDNYYGNFTFAGDDKYRGCTYDGNVTVIAN